MLPHLLNNFEIQKYYQNELKFNGVYCRNNLPKINLDQYELIGTHWIALYDNAKNVTDFDSFGVKHFQNELENSQKIKMWKICIEYKHMFQ